jgi:hypothetical protein
MMKPASLPCAPSQIVGADGVPAVGRFTGLAESFDWQRLAAPHARTGWWRRFHHKRWHYAALATPDLFCAAAVVDVGWTNTAFAYVFDRAARRVVASISRDGIPGLTASVAHNAHDESRFALGGNRIALSRQQLTVQCKTFSIDAQFDAGAAPVLLAVGEAVGGSVHATQKSGGLPLRGMVNAGGRVYRLDGGTASYDYSNGLLGRDTAWRWASAHGPGMGFNLQAGYFGAHENALWLDGRIYPLAAAHFEYDAADPLAPWRVTTSDGLLDLVFSPEGARREDRNLIVAATRYVQPIGTFDGWVRADANAPKVRVEALAGVTEDHSSRW